MISKILTALTLATAVNAASYTTSFTSAQTPMYANDYLRSANNHATFFMMGNGDTALSYASALVQLTACVNSSEIKPTLDGRMICLRTAAFGYDMYFGNVPAACNSNSAGTWRLQLDNDMRLRVISTCGTTGFDNLVTYLDFPFSGSEGIYNQVLDTFRTSRNITAGAGTAILYIDSGIANRWDPSVTMHDWQYNWWKEVAVIQEDPNDVTSGFFDHQRHGTPMALIAKSNFLGLAQATIPGNIKVVYGWGWHFSEKAFVTGVQAAVNFADPINPHKILNWSGHFPASVGGNGNIVNCALQWAFKSGLSVVAAAGNSDSNVAERNPYALVIGAHDKPGSAPGQQANIHHLSNFGNYVDLWAPHNFFSEWKSGTSFATAYTSAALAHAISYWPAQLKFNVNRGYKYIVDRARTTLVNPSHSKVTASTRAGVKSLSLLNMAANAPATGTYFNEATATDFCGALGYSRDTPNWTALINAANATKYGFLVNSGAGGSNQNCQWINGIQICKTNGG